MGVDFDESLVAEVDEKVFTFFLWTCGPYSKRDDDDAWQDIIKDSIALAMWQSYV